jgi:3-hydroxyisobutyrate dehydrogenase-like beta-hydroxyacid dehydrogenase
VALMADVAVVGTGRMGAAFVTRLTETGHTVTVFNRTRAKAEEVAERTGAHVADSPAAAAGSAPVVRVSLADDPALAAAYRGTEGIAAGVGREAVVVDTSTVAPSTVRQMEPLVSARGAALLDAPVSGSVPVVLRGELTVLAGGDAQALERARPVLSPLAGRVFHTGAIGTGAVVKLAVNSIVHALNQALSEALVLAERSGVQRATAYEVFANSVVGAPFLQYKQQAYLEPETTPVAFALELVAKDQRLIAALAEEAGARMELTEAGHALVGEAVDAGLGSHDMSALARYLRD